MSGVRGGGAVRINLNNMNQDGDLGEFWSNSICLRKLTETKVINYIDLCLENYKY